MDLYPNISARRFGELDPGSLFIGQHDYVKACYIKCFETQAGGEFRYRALMLGPDVPHPSRAPCLVSVGDGAGVLDLGRDFIVDVLPSPVRVRFALPTETDPEHGIVFAGHRVYIRAHRGEGAMFQGCYVDIESGEISAQPLRMALAMLDTWSIRVKLAATAAGGLSKPLVSYPVD
jgi:hypothetical protein